MFAEETFHAFVGLVSSYARQQGIYIKEQNNAIETQLQFIDTDRFTYCFRFFCFPSRLVLFKVILTFPGTASVSGAALAI